ncbi:MAG TPA: surface-adhesin E family protein [Sulfuricella sp.]|nr:surface-adhesin E family protein [Sulfuricella sp.]
MFRVLRVRTVVAVLGFAAAISAQAANWESVIQIGDHVREIDTSSIKSSPPVVTYVTRHVFGNLDEYRIGKHGIKYLVIAGKADCNKRTTSKLTVEARGEKMELISKQTIQDPEDTVVSPDSIEESVLNYVCKPKK